MDVTGHHARLGTRLRARLCRGPHFRRLNPMSFQGTTRIDPCEPDLGTRLPPRVLSVEAPLRPRMQNAWSWQPVVDEPRHLLPSSSCTLAAAHQRTLPKLSNTDSEHHQAPIGPARQSAEPAAARLPVW